MRYFFSRGIYTFVHAVLSLVLPHCDKRTRATLRLLSKQLSHVTDKHSKRIFKLNNYLKLQQQSSSTSDSYAIDYGGSNNNSNSNHNNSTNSSSSNDDDNNDNNNIDSIRSTVLTSLKQLLSTGPLWGLDFSLNNTKGFFQFLPLPPPSHFSSFSLLFSIIQLVSCQSFIVLLLTANICFVQQTKLGYNNYPHRLSTQYLSTRFCEPYQLALFHTSIFKAQKYLTTI